MDRDKLNNGERYKFERVVKNFNTDNPEKSSEMFERGINKPRNKIVLFGVWLIMGSTVGICIFILSMMAYSLSEDIDNLTLTIFFAVFFVFILILSISVLYNVTKKYFSMKT